MVCPNANCWIFHRTSQPGYKISVHVQRPPRSKGPPSATCKKLCDEYVTRMLRETCSRGIPALQMRTGEYTECTVCQLRSVVVFSLFSCIVLLLPYTVNKDEHQRRHSLLTRVDKVQGHPRSKGPPSATCKKIVSRNYVTLTSYWSLVKVVIGPSCVTVFTF